MLSYFAAHLQVDSVLELSPEKLGQLGLQGLLLDVDGTLKDYRATDVAAPVRDWIESLRREGIRLCLLSNGKAKRIERFAGRLNLPFIATAFKPLPFGCVRGIRCLGVSPGRAAVVGDQLFADVLAGRLAGLFTILVRPTSLEEPWFTRLKRPLERRLLQRMRSSNQVQVLDSIEA